MKLSSGVLRARFNYVCNGLDDANLLRAVMSFVCTSLSQTYQTHITHHNNFEILLCFNYANLLVNDRTQTYTEN